MNPTDLCQVPTCNKLSTDGSFCHYHEVLWDKSAARTKTGFILQLAREEHRQLQGRLNLSKIDGVEWMRDFAVIQDELVNTEFVVDDKKSELAVMTDVAQTLRKMLDEAQSEVRGLKAILSDDGN